MSDVSPIGEVGKHYITATIGSNITMRSITSLRLAATSLLSHGFKSILKNEKYLFYLPFTKNNKAIELYSKGQFCKNTVYRERGMPYFFAFVTTNAVLVSKIDKL